MRGVPGGFAARNRGADYVEYLVPSLRAGTLIRPPVVKGKSVL